MIYPQPLPYRGDALEPWVSALTMGLHYALYEGYIQRINGLTTAPDLAQAYVHAEQLGNVPFLRDVKQAMNHEFLWPSMAPPHTAGPSPELVGLMEMRWRTAGNFYAEFEAGARSVFGSGWAWIVVTPGGLEVRTTSGADMPAEPPLLVLDMWEHAYVCEYGIYRGDYVDGFLRGHANWDAAQHRLEALR